MGAEFTFHCRRMLRRFPIFHRFATFALRLGPFAPEFCRQAPVCSGNDAFPERNRDLNSGGEFTFHCRRMLRRFQIFHRFSTFASTSAPVSLQTLQLLFSLQTSATKTMLFRGPEFSRRSIRLQRERWFFFRISSFCKTLLPTAGSLMRAQNRGRLAGTSANRPERGRWIRTLIFLTPIRTLRGKPLLGNY